MSPKTRTKFQRPSHHGRLFVFRSIHTLFTAPPQSDKTRPKLHHTPVFRCCTNDFSSWKAAYPLPQYSVAPGFWAWTRFGRLYYTRLPPQTLVGRIDETNQTQTRWSRNAAVFNEHNTPPHRWEYWTRHRHLHTRYQVHTAASLLSTAAPLRTRDYTHRDSPSQTYINEL